MKHKDENALRQALEEKLKIGSATVEDALWFCKKNKPIFWEPDKLDPKILSVRKHEMGIVFSTRASLGIFRLSNWRNLLRSFYRIWWFLFISGEWRIFLYFDNNVLAEIEVLRFEHWL
ncbi:MAG: hypothetical protein GC179_21160 [Anaerolineaceae bacterium]|nr:hypothetical protein [Anaerolineaceae bacterium]